MLGVCKDKSLHTDSLLFLCAVWLKLVWVILEVKSTLGVGRHGANQDSERVIECHLDAPSLLVK